MIPLLIASALAAPATTDELIETARHRALKGDYAGARIVAEQALERPGEHHRQAKYLIALSLEYGGDPQAALDIYDSLLSTGTSPDIQFRRAETLGRLKEWPAAIRQLRRLQRSNELDPEAQLKVNLLEGAWLVERGKARKGLQQLSQTLETASSDQAQWHQSMVRCAIIRYAVTAADQIEIPDDARRQDAIQERTALVRLAEEQLGKLIPLDATQWTIEGLYLLGSTYGSFGRAMVEHSSDPTDRQRAGKVWKKGLLFFDRANTLAADRSWSGDPLPQIKTESERLASQIEGK